MTDKNLYIAEQLEPEPVVDCPENPINRTWNDEFPSKGGMYLYWGWNGQEFLRNSVADLDTDGNAMLALLEAMSNAGHEWVISTCVNGDWSVETLDSIDVCAPTLPLAVRDAAYKALGGE